MEALARFGMTPEPATLPSSRWRRAKGAECRVVELRSRLRLHTVRSIRGSHLTPAAARALISGVAVGRCGNERMHGVYCDLGGLS